jgi:hypothetical protein
MVSSNPTHSLKQLLPPHIWSAFKVTCTETVHVAYSINLVTCEADTSRIAAAHRRS